MLWYVGDFQVIPSSSSNKVRCFCFFWYPHGSNMWHVAVWLSFVSVSGTNGEGAVSLVNECCRDQSFWLKNNQCHKERWPHLCLHPWIHSYCGWRKRTRFQRAEAVPWWEFGPGVFLAWKRDATLNLNNVVEKAGLCSSEVLVQNVANGCEWIC